MTTRDTEPKNEADEYAAALEAAGMLEDSNPAPEGGDDAGEPQAKPQDAPAPEPVAADSDEPFPGYNALPEDARKAIDERIAAEAKRASDFEQRWRAQHGQLAPTQRELEQARRQARELAERLQELEKARPAPEDDVLQRFREQYPEEAEALDALSKQFESRADRLARENEELRNLVQGVHGTFERQRAEAALSERHSDWREIDSNPMFRDWLNTLSPQRQALAGSSNPAEVADLIDDYKRDLALAQALAGNTRQAPSRQPAISPNPTVRQSPGPRASNVQTSEADEYAAALQAAGYKV